MQYILTFIWAFLLSQMINFVLHSLGGSDEALNFVSPTIYAIIFTVVIILLDALVGKSSSGKQSTQHS
ncbi:MULTISPECIES: YjzD family protein [Mammaliicoccus]|uniref:YjzD family protein n=1 Tax=Mammaliicoccus sciuri TaxID=1296 RepID=A0ABT7HVF0_MAMSC|nr:MULTISPECIES: YjzD family protein [Mammaliicoccus]MBF9298286.1 YjzD family protein [Staphylococcus schleiferi]MCJ0913368.1 YjzD family protein [Mammaliicoccus sciuri]MCJ0942596.1 YjzD family protein [Mammaliicoccus sciuri]MDL0112443.1 YjzD family protein [Mammaliicoccus sciuri]MDL0116124.1 YjzD family protein [Mammaliicoccus sciuri]